MTKKYLKLRVKTMSENKIPRSILERKADKYKELIYLISNERYIVTENESRELVLIKKEDNNEKGE